MKGTRELWLTYGSVPGGERLKGYPDADGSMVEDHHVISSYAFLLDGGVVSWSSKRQEIVSLSTTESEYIAITHARKEAKWLRSLIGEVFWATAEPTTLFSNNQSVIALTQDTSTTPIPNILTSGTTSSTGWSIMACSILSTVQLRTWSLIHS